MSCRDVGWEVPAGMFTESHGALWFVLHSASTSNVAKIEEMERLLREAQAEKHRLLEHRVSTVLRLRTTDLSVKTSSSLTGSLLTLKSPDLKYKEKHSGKADLLTSG